MKWKYSLQDFPALFAIWGNFNLNFPALFVKQKQKRKSAGKFKFSESCSEYHHFIHYLCFSN